MLKKSAFTMIELIMVIVVMGILAALALPRMERDYVKKQEIIYSQRYGIHSTWTING